jgi:hypothetical protein
MKALKKERGQKRKMYCCSSWWRIMEQKDGISLLHCSPKEWESSVEKDGTIISILIFRRINGL